MDDRADSIIRLPARLMLTAGASGSGKTLITCGLLQLLKEKGLRVSCFKCGPDYIDPMFHSAVLGVPSGNLDTFFTPGRTVASLFSAQAEGTDLAVLEGVMGYYDGLGGISTKASAYDVACTVDTPAVLIVPGSAATRDTEAIKRICTAYLKLLFPNATDVSNVNISEFETYCLIPAKRMRGVIKSQLGIIDYAEFGGSVIPNIQVKEKYREK